MSTTPQQAADRLIASTPVIAELGALFGDAGHELYLVGGPVRDALLGRRVHDLDFTTSADPDLIERLLRSWTKAVWTIGKEFGTIGARRRDPASPIDVDGSDDCTGKDCTGDDCRGEDWVIEITTFRADSYASDSRKPTVEFGDNITDDLVRRDFTVNAMAIDVVGGRFVDPHGGLRDLAARELRTPAAPEVSFGDDPLRMLRAARFTSQLLFEPSAEVVAAMTAMAGRIDIISAERVRDELSRLLLTDHPHLGLDLLVTTGLAERVLPELPALRLERDEHHRHKDVYEHSLTVLDQAIALEKSRGHEPDLVLRLASLLHDIGKPMTRQFVGGGKVTFHHHDVVGAKLARKRMQALRFSVDETKAVCRLIELHLRFHGYADGVGTDPHANTAGADGQQAWTDSAVRRYVRDAGDQLERLHILTRSDCTTRNQRKASRLAAAYDDLEARIAVLAEEEELGAMRPDLDGTQIMAILGIKPGREVGEAYQFLLERRIEEGPLGEQRATEELLAWWAARSGAATST